MSIACKFVAVNNSKSFHSTPLCADQAFAAMLGLARGAAGVSNEPTTRARLERHTLLGLVATLAAEN